jgi:hypothetical protein
MSKSYKIAGLVGILLAVMVATTYVTGTTPEALGNKPRSEATTSAEKTATAAAAGPVKLPASIGPKTAPVKIKVYVTSDNHCDTTTVEGLKKVAKKFGKDVRIEYVDLLNKGVKAEAEKAKIGCKSGITLNGKSALRVPDKTIGAKGFVMFDGQFGTGKNYGVREVEAGVKYLLEIQKAVSKGKPEKKAGA